MNPKIYHTDCISILVLDYKKKQESYDLLCSIEYFCKFPKKVIFLDNGSGEPYPQEFKDSGLIDELIINKENTGLGLGTKTLFAAAKSEFSYYVQNDQYFGKEITTEYIDFLKDAYDKLDSDGNKIKSISLAGAVCGNGIYSERGHFIKNSFYQFMEETIPLSKGGAGKFANLIWREEQIQNYYKKNKYVHYTQLPPVIQDNGSRSIRENPDGSVWQHNPDDKRLWLIKGPIKEKFVYPKFTESEWISVLETQSWEPGRVPEREISESFTIPQWH